MPRVMARCAHPSVLLGSEHPRALIGPVGTLPYSPWPRRGAAARGGVGAYVDGGSYDASRGRHVRRDGDLAVGSVHATVVRACPLLPSHCARADTPNPQIDSLVPAYACPVADAVRDAFEDVPAWAEHLSANALLKARLDAAAGLDAWASWCMYCSSPNPTYMCLTFLMH
jgi:hypothetical protein